MAALKLYNPLTRKLEVFKPLKGKTVNLYTCGPTVYDEAHIGNLRSYIFADILRRTLEYNGCKVRWAMNITDVDDKTIKRTVDEFGSRATPKELRAYTGRFIAKFKNDLREVNVPTDPKHITFIRVSDKINAIKGFIKKLIKLGYAYKSPDGVYFSIQKYQKKFGDYGALVGKDFLRGKKTGARVRVDDYEKENLSDFALWKGRDRSDGKIFWRDAELGDGRPGWHIECSVMNYEAFGGEPTDIHTGGVDLIFPHHTNEIAQSQPIYKPFVRYWVHGEHLLVNGRKMAKRENNFYALDHFRRITPHAGLAFRYVALQTNYGTQMNFSADMGNDLRAISRLNAAASENKTLASKRVESAFRAALYNNLNTAKALSVVSKVRDSRMNIGPLLDLLGLKKTIKSPPIPAKIRELVRKRERSRKNKQFTQADLLRKEIEGLGYIVEDTPKGPRTHPKNHAAKEKRHA